MIENGPPHNATAEEQANWYRARGVDAQNIPTTADLERACSYCGSINPCTGVSTCGQCGKSLADAQRIRSSFRHSPGSAQRRDG